MFDVDFRNSSWRFACYYSPAERKINKERRKKKMKVSKKSKTQSRKRKLLFIAEEYK
jgi:hypothetical protein